MKAYIKKDDKDNNAMWLIVERPTKRTIMVYGDDKDEDNHIKDFVVDEGVAYPILKDEIEVIYEACRKYLEERGDNVENN